MSKEAHTLLEEITQYTNDALAQVTKHYDATEEYPAEYVDYFFKRDIFRLLLSEHSEAEDFYTFINIIQIVAKQFLSLASILLTQGTYGVWTIHRFGTHAKKKQDRKCVV